MANSYYAAAVKSGSVSWKAFFFGSLDPGSFITVDKPPAALWVMSLSARIFGFSSWSMLVPEAVAGVASVLILHHLVRKWAGDLPAHLAALALAITPVAVLMFRYNNPDAFLTLLCLGAAWALWSALESGRTRYLLIAGGLLGLAFDTKMLQAFLVLPAMALVYLIAGPPKLGRRLIQLVAAGGALLVAGGWWVLAVVLWPTASRPYIGSTTDNSLLSLIFGYNGLSRIFGSGTGGGGGAGGGGGFGSTPGLWRLFNSEIGGDIAWLLPVAFVGLVAGLWLTRRGDRTSLGRAGWILWGGWALMCAAVFSLSKGIFHPYYTVQMAPAVAALAGAGGVALWHVGRRHRGAGWILPATIVVTAGVAVMILGRTPEYEPWLRPAIAVGAALAAAGLLAGTYLRHLRVITVAAVLAAGSLLAAPAAFALTTVNGSSSGSIPTAGPSSGGRFGGGGLGTSTADSGLITYLEAHQGNAKYLVATFTSQASAPIIITSGKPVITIGGFNGSDPAPTLAQFEQLVAEGKVRYVLISGAGFGAGVGPLGAAGGGSGLDGGTAGIGGGAGLGGGTDGGAGQGSRAGGARGGGSGGGSGTSSAISAWVTAHGTEVPASNYGSATGGGTLYLVSASTSSTS